MKELLKKGDAEIPKRSISMNVAKPMGMQAAKFTAQGSVDYDLISKKSNVNQIAPDITEQKGSPKSSLPPPAQSRVVFSGSQGLGLGGIAPSSGGDSSFLPSIGKR